MTTTQYETKCDLREIKCEGCHHEAMKHTNPENLDYMYRVRRKRDEPSKIFPPSPDLNSSCSECPCVMKFVKFKVGENEILEHVERMVDGDQIWNGIFAMQDLDGLAILQNLVKERLSWGKSQIEYGWNSLDGYDRHGIVSMDIAYNNVIDLIQALKNGGK